MQTKLKNTKTAITLTTVIVLIVIAFAPFPTFMRTQSKAESLYFSGGSYGKDNSVHENIEVMADDVLNLCTVARQAGLDDDIVDSAWNSAEDIKKHNEPTKVKSYYDSLKRQMEELYLTLSDRTLNEQQEQYLNRYYADFHSADGVIIYSEYNDSAYDYNQKLRPFPANLYTTLYRVKELPEFK